MGEQEPTQQAPKDSIDKILDVVGGGKKMGEAIETLFGPSNPAGGAGGPAFVPSHVGGAPPQLAQPYGFNPAGAGGGQMPGAPQGVGGGGPVTPPGIMRTGTEFRTSGGKNAAVVGGAIENISGALKKFGDTKKEENIQHAKFLYDLVKTSYEREGNDSATANLILGDPKNRATIEKYLTGKLPRVAGGPAPEAGKKHRDDVTGKINQPGGVALPATSPQQQFEAAKLNAMIKGMKENDPRVMASVFGEHAALSKEDFATATKAKYGIELAPAQLQVMDAQAKLAMSEAKVDMLKYLAGQDEITRRAMEVARLHGGSAKDVANINAKAKLDSMRMYSQALKDIKGAPADKMESIIYKSLADTYRNLSTEYARSAGKLAKDNPEQAAAFDKQSKDWANKAKGMEEYHDANKYYKDVIEGGDPAGEELEIEEKPPKEEPD